MTSKKVTSALVATLLLSHTVLAPLTVAAQEQEVSQVQETQTQTTDASTDISPSLSEVEPVVPDTSDSSSEPTEDVSSETADTTTPEAPVQDESQTQTESSEPATVTDDTATPNARAGFSLNDWEWRERPAGGGYILTKYIGSGGAVEIPGTFNGKQVYIESKEYYDSYFKGTRNGLGLGNKSVTSISCKAINGVKVKVYGNKLDGMFGYSNTLTKVDLSGLDTSNVESMYEMFEQCTSLTDISGLSGLDTSNVITMSNMFYGCRSLSDITSLSKWETNKVQAMNFTFCNCGISDISPLSSWKTGSLTYMTALFSSCSSLKDLTPLKDWKTGNVTRIDSVFFNCRSLIDLSPISGWDTSSATDMSDMFAYCASAASYGSLDLTPLEGWKTGSVTDMSRMFTSARIGNITALAQWDVSKVTNMSEMFQWSDASKLNAFKEWKVGNVTDMSRMFLGTGVSDTTPISQWDVSKVTDMSDMFNTTSIELADVSGWQLNANVNISRMFARGGFPTSGTPASYSDKTMLIIAKDEKFKNHDYLSEKIHPVTTKFDPDGGTFSDGSTDQKTVEQPYVISDTSDAAINKLLTTAQETAKKTFGNPTKVGGYTFNTWQAGTLPTETNPAKVIYNKLTNTYTAKYYARNFTVPTTIDFGSHKLAVGEKTYAKPTLTGNALQVNDDFNQQWYVDAKLLSELQNENGYQMPNALRYKTGSTEKVFSTSSINIASGKGTKNLSDDWSDTNGLMLKTDSSKHKPGKYKTTIEWTFKDTP